MGANPFLPAIHLLRIGVNGHGRDLAVPPTRQPDKGVRGGHLRAGVAGRDAPHAHARDVSIRFDPVILDLVGVAIEAGDNPDRISRLLARAEHLPRLPEDTWRM